MFVVCTVFLAHKHGFSDTQSMTHGAHTDI